MCQILKLVAGNHSVYLVEVGNMVFRVFIKQAFYAVFRRIVVLAELLVRYDYKNAVTPNVSLDTIRSYNRQRQAIPNRIICNAPFRHMYFRQDGKVTACCATASTPYGDIRKESVRDIWQSEQVKALRTNISNYNLSGGCSGCRYALETANYPAFTGRVYDSWLPDAATAYPTEMTFETSNICNLECIMCNGQFSSLIRKNVEQLPALPNHYDESFLQQILEFLPYLKKVRFMGGEPFLIKEYLPIMNFLTEKNPDCKIYIQTNGTVLNNYVKKIMESGNVELSISVDSLNKETYEVIRKNASFEKMMENMDYFTQRARDFHQTININFCVMKNNWNEVPDILLYCYQHNFSLNLLPVENPRQLSLRLLSAEEISVVYDYTLQHQPVMEHPLLNQVVEGYLNHLQSLRAHAVMRANRKKVLQEESVIRLYETAKALYATVNLVDGDGQVVEIFEEAYRMLDVLPVKVRAALLSDIILDMESVATDNIIPQRYEEIRAKTQSLFRDIIKEYQPC